MKGWRKVKIKEIAAPTKNAIVGGPFGSNLVSRDYVPKGVPVIRGQNMGFGRWVGGEFVFVSEEKGESLSPNTARPGDLVFTQRGTLGQIALVPQEPFDRYIVSQSQMKLTVDPTQADAKFLYYLFNTEEQQDYIRRNAIQTGVPHTNLDHLRNTPVLLPPLSEQRTIASILGTLDDKIELNRRMNETLEAMAQALFKSWFVDPTQNGLPKGWSMRALYDCADYINGAAFRNEHFSADRTGLPVIKIGELKEGITAQTKFCAIEREPKYRINSGDILFSWSGSPDTSINTFIWTGGEAWLNQHIFKIQLKRPVEKYFVYYLLKHFNSEFIEIARNKQTTGLGHVTVQDLKRLQTAFPLDNVLQKFNTVAEPLFQTFYLNLCESRTLATVRDSLLPQLLSGKMRVTTREIVPEGEEINTL